MSLGTGSIGGSALGAEEITVESETISLSLSLVWNIHNTVVKPVTRLVWNIYSEIPFVNLNLKWNISNPVESDLNLIWEIIRVSEAPAHTRFYKIPAEYRIYLYKKE